MYNKLVKTFSEVSPPATGSTQDDRRSVFTRKEDIRKALYCMFSQQCNSESCPVQWELFDAVSKPIPQAVYKGLDLPDVDTLAHRLRYELMSVEEAFWHLYDSVPEDRQQEIIDVYKMGRNLAFLSFAATLTMSLAIEDFFDRDTRKPLRAWEKAHVRFMFYKFDDRQLCWLRKHRAAYV
ncbi:hypothetical protein MPER_02733, partial [Moniliophthora perniciosa FA553]